MATAETKLWRKDPAANEWKLERAVPVSAAHQWLLDAKAKLPDSAFKLSQSRPTN
jgi:hypothetical protein